MSRPAPGDVYTVRRRISTAVIRAFGELTCDLAAHHVSPEVERPVAHGAYLLASLSMLGGRSALGHRISVELLAAARAGDVVETRIEVTDVRAGGRLGVLVAAEFTMKNQAGTLVGRGSVSYSVPHEEADTDAPSITSAADADSD
jgi:acyl dehydratase